MAPQDDVDFILNKNKSKGMDFILTQLATKYKITPAVKTKVKKAVNG